MKWLAAQSHSLINSFSFTLTTYKECSRSMLAQVLTSTFKSSNLTSILSYLLSLHESIHTKCNYYTIIITFDVIVCIIAKHLLNDIIIIIVPEGKLVGFLSRGFLSGGFLSEIRIPVLTNQIVGFVTTIV